MKLVVGLGNPGPKYRGTRHNIGFDVVDVLAARWQLTDAWRERDEALYVKRGVEAVLVKPLTYMNLSGMAASRLRRFFQVEPAEVLVIVDEAALPVGRLRARPRGSAGGHNGLKSIIEQFGTDEFPRLRVGVGRGDVRRDLSDHVLSRFATDERDTIASAIERAADATELFLADGIELVMSRFNAAADSMKKEEEEQNAKESTD